MKIKISAQRKVFLTFNYLFLIIIGIICLIPFINLLAISFSSSDAVTKNVVGFWPVGFTTKSYQFVINNANFITAFLVSIKRVILGVSINMILTVLVAYPLSKEKSSFRWRNIYVWFFLITILFNAGLIPWYLVIKYTGIMDTIWALVLPGALPVFNMIVLLNFFRSLPKELEEAACIDGASHFRILWQIFIPLSKPAIATVSLFCIVGHWNAWFDGLILMNAQSHYPLQSYLQTIIISPEDYFKAAMNSSSDINSLLKFINVRTSKSAQLFIAALPVLVAYPFLQKYFATGLTIGSVKG